MLTSALILALIEVFFAYEEWNKFLTFLPQKTEEFGAVFSSLSIVQNSLPEFPAFSVIILGK